MTPHACTPRDAGPSVSLPRSNAPRTSQEENRNLSFQSLSQRSRCAPDGKSCSRLECCFECTKSSFLAGAAWNEQNVIALKWNVRFFPGEYVLHIHCHLLTLIGVALQAQNSGVSRVSSSV